MKIVRIVFRAPQGEELNAERLEALEELGVPEQDVFLLRPGKIMIRHRFSAASIREMERLVEEFAETVIDAITDMDMLDYEFSE